MGKNCRLISKNPRAIRRHGRMGVRPEEFQGSGRRQSNPRPGPAARRIQREAGQEPVFRDLGGGFRAARGIPDPCRARWWMVCPIAGQRVRTLILPIRGNLFASRAAWNLTYESRRRDRLTSIAARYNRLFERLYADSPDGFPVRPKGMWESTFNRLCDELDRLDTVRERELGKVFAKLADRHPSLRAYAEDGVGSSNPTRALKGECRLS